MNDSAHHTGSKHDADARCGHKGHRKDTVSWGSAAKATLHCLTGCAVGEILGTVIGTALLWGTVPTTVLAIVLAFAFGYSFTCSRSVGPAWASGPQ